MPKHPFLAALAAALALSAQAQPPSAPASAPAPPTFTVGDPGRSFDSASARGSILTIHFISELGSEHCRLLIQEYTAGAPTLAGVRQVLVSAEPADGFTSAVTALPADSIPAYHDADGRLAAQFTVVPSNHTILILGPTGKELFRKASTSPTDHFSFAVLAAKVAELTRNKEASEANVPSSSHLAIEGFDPTSYLDEHKAVPGDKKIESAFRGITYRFASATNRDKFNTEPAKYLPAYGGWCATAMAKNDKVEIDPKNFKVTGGRTFLFYKGLFGNALNDWNKDEPGLTQKADANWKTLSTEK